MKCFKAIAGLAVVTALRLFVSLPVLADDTPGGKTDIASDAKAPGTQSSKTFLTYIPPMRGTPGGRIGGGTRGATSEYPDILALVPDHTGLTIQEQPTLFWFLSKPVSHPIEFSIIADDAVRPLVETRLKDAGQPGVHCVRLADYGVHLKKDAGYQWYIALVTAPNERSKDIIAGGRIERIDPPGDLDSKLGKAGKANAPQVYAQNGLWYDSLGAVSDLIAASPADKTLKSERISLLRQVGLSEVADYEMK